MLEIIQGFQGGECVGSSRGFQGVCGFIRGFPGGVWLSEVSGGLYDRLSGLPGGAVVHLESC